MSQTIKSNKRLCEKLKEKNVRKNCHEICAHDKEKHGTKIKAKPKKCAPNTTFSMIKFYESIPNYDEIRHLPEYDFAQRLEFLRKIHCDLSEPLLREPCAKRITSSSSSSRRCKKKKCVKKKKSNSATTKCVVSPSLCNSFSKTSLVEFDDIGSSKRSTADTATSANSLNLPTPKRLQVLRQRILSDIDDFDGKIENKCSTPKFLSPIYSPKYHCDEVDRSHFHHVRASHPHPCDLYYPNHCLFDKHLEHRSPVRCADIDPEPPKMQKSPKVTVDPKHLEHEHKLISMEAIKKKLRRAKSVPKDMFSPANYFPNERGSDNDCNDRVYFHSSCHDNSSLFRSTKLSPSTASPQPRSTEKIIPKIKINKPKSKSPNTMDSFLSSKLVRNNLASNLRHKWSRKKLSELAQQQLQATLRVEKFIPKCHRWNVRESPAWKTFTSEDTTAEKIQRAQLRREEEKVRQHTHSMSMNVMRARVRSAQLLLEGRALSPKP